ncbi:MAG: CoA transferase, partial [bacterium]
RGRHIECDLLQSTSALQGVNLVRAALEGDTPYAAATPSGTYRTVDGYLNVTVLQEVEFPVFCDVMGLDSFKEDPRFATAQLRFENREPLQAALRELFARQGCSAWSAKLTAAGILHERVNTYREMLEHPQVAASETVDWLDEPSTGRVPIPRIPGSPRSSTPALPPPAPHIGQHGEQILAELGYAPDQIAGLLARKVVVKPAPAREIP